MTEGISSCYKEDLPQRISDWQLAFIGLMLVLCVIAVVIPPARAMTITMSNPGAANSRDIIVYNSTGEMQGFYNDTSVITLDGNYSYVFMLKPMSSNPMTDPGDWLTNQAFPFVSSNIIAIGVICFFIGLIFWRH